MNGVSAGAVLEAKTEGWAAGLRLAGFYLKGHKNLKLRLEKLSGSSVHIAEYLALSGPRNPYPGKLGVVEEGALADLLLVDGNPLKDISILIKPEKNLALIMKDGVIYKNTLE